MRKEILEGEDTFPNGEIHQTYSYEDEKFVNAEHASVIELSLSEFEISDFKKVFAPNLLVEKKASGDNREYPFYCSTFKTKIKRSLPTVKVKMYPDKIQREQEIIRWNRLPKDEKKEIKRLINEELKKFVFVYQIREVLVYNPDMGEWEIGYTIRGVEDNG